MKLPKQSLGRVIVIGAGIGGLAAALPLVHRRYDVTILERHAAPGGKMRQIGGVDAGPTVLTMLDVFEALFMDVGESLSDHVTLIPQDILARHWWPDSGPLDLFPCAEKSADAIGAFAGSKSRDEFLTFTHRAARLFDGFRDPMMLRAEPKLGSLAKHVIMNPRLLLDMGAGKTLKSLLRSSFSDPRLQQLFGRYATYVGGSPDRSPALLSLIWEAEARGVWCVQGGMHALARSISDLIQSKGGKIRLNADVQSIETRSGGVSGVTLATGEHIPTDQIVFNGDPRALALGLLGDAVQPIAQITTKRARSHSANVWSFRATPSDIPLSHHNVFFCDPGKNEFADIERGEIPSDPTLYVCAEDRGQNTPVPDEERFEIIMNTPPLTQRAAQSEDYETCHTRTFPRLQRFGLTFSPEPDHWSLTTAKSFDALFPGSAGSLYGQTPHGMMAALERPTARTSIKGLYLAGGSTHPGAGVPMAAISGRHAAAAIVTDQISTSRFRQTATRGGMSTASPTTANALSRSSGS
ncbi:FAD-dependent oxidoreductase [Marivita sp. S6314]|nr:1-hydroxycarotenoid 3,4-desaturase CrtD [Marivita sp. S6314]MCK0151290.1 FAD-dependent oxidoreductase [Marivita sp. S6314]